VVLVWLGDPKGYADGSLLLVGYPLPDILKVMAQTKRGTLFHQVGGWAAGKQPAPVKTLVMKTQRMSLGRNKNSKQKIGTQNILSLYRPRASNILEQELGKVQMDLVALQEIRWLEDGTLEKKSCAIFYSCNPVRHVLHVGFYVSSRLLPNIWQFKPVNDRLCWIRVHGKFRNCNIINVHAPIEDKDDEEKDKFYLELETIYSQCPKHDVKMVLGDFNANVGTEEIIIPMQEEMDCMKNLMKMGINWYTLLLQQI